MRISALVAAFVALWAVFGSLPVRAQTTEQKIERAMHDAGYKYNKYNSTTWSIDFDKKNIGKLKVILSSGSNILVAFTNPATKAQIKKTTQFMEELLHANYEYDYVKVGLDKDDDMFVRIDTPLDDIDGDTLKAVVEQVANASDEIFGNVSSFITR